MSFLDSELKSQDLPHFSSKFEWEDLFENEQTIGRDVITDDNHNIYVAGNIFNSSKGAYDVLLCKYNSSGSMMWNVSWGGMLDDFAYALDINTTSTNIYVTGRTASYGISESNDIFLLSYDSSGYLQRNITWGGKYSDVGYGIECDSNFIYISGYTNSFSSSEDIVALKYNTSYLLEWDKIYSTSETDIGYGITINNSDSIFITGKTNSSGNEDLILMKLDSNGNQRWNITWGGSNSDEGRSIISNTLDEIFVLANTRSYGLGSTDFALLKFNSTGGLERQQLWGGTDLDIGYKLINNSLFDLFLIGYTESYGSAGKDACIVKYNSSGEYQWYRMRGDNLEDIAYSGCIDFDDSLYITGEANNQLFLTKYNPRPSNFNLTHNATIPDSDGTFDIFWSEPLDAVNYSLYLSNSSITEINSSVTKIVEGNTNRTISFTNLEEGTYYYIVVAFNDYGNTTSNLINITVQYPPSGFFLFHDAEFPDKDGTVNFSWSPSQGVDYYELYINTTLYKDNITENSYLISDLDTNDYRVYVNAVNDAGQHKSNEILIYIRRIPTPFSFSTDATDPDKDGIFELMWTKSSFASYYVIYNSSTFISEINSSVSVLLNFTPSLDLPTYRYNISGLNNGTYYYKIIAYNQYGNFSTDCVQVRVAFPPRPPIPQEPIEKDKFRFPQEIIFLIIFGILFSILIIVYKKHKK